MKFCFFSVFIKIHTKNLLSDLIDVADFKFPKTAKASVKLNLNKYFRVVNKY